MAVTVENIIKLKYFKDISPDSLGDIPHFFNQKSYIKGQTILSEGETVENLHFVGSGVVKVFKVSSEGKEQIIKIIRPGESFNDVAVFSRGPCPYSAQALGVTTVVYWIHKSNLMPLIERNFKIAQNAIEIVAEQERLLLELIEDLSFKNVVGRVAKILLQNAAPVSEGYQRLTQYEMAAMVGTAREVVGRSLKSLEDMGAIKLERHKIIIKNRDHLTRLAGLN
jgi:CRP/FNR family transcriptional regulator